MLCQFVILLNENMNIYKIYTIILQLEICYGISRYQVKLILEITWSNFSNCT